MGLFVCLDKKSSGVLMRRKNSSKKNNAITLGFEEKLWQAADKM